MAKALITGITGQCGSYLAELLLENGYEVHGIIRRSASFNTGKIDHIFGQLHLHHGDLLEPMGLCRLLTEIKPDEIYNLAAQSHVKVSFNIPLYTADVTGLGAFNLLEAVRIVCPESRFYQASSSEMFGNATSTVDGREMQNESTRFYPRSPYAVAKCFAHHATINYREAYDLHASCGICFNMESPRRGETFVTRKTTHAIARIKAGLQRELVLGNLTAKRDWGWVPDYVGAMHMMLQEKQPDDYVIATGETHTVKEFVELAFRVVGMNWEDYVTVDQNYFRPTEVDYLCGDSTKIRKKLDWKPSVGFEELVRRMVEADISSLHEQRH